MLGTMPGTMLGTMLGTMPAHNNVHDDGHLWQQLTGMAWVQSLHCKLATLFSFSHEEEPKQQATVELLMAVDSSDCKTVSPTVKDQMILRQWTVGFDSSDVDSINDFFIQQVGCCSIGMKL